MKQTEEQLLKRDKIAATLGDELVLEVLNEKRELVIAQIKAMAASDSQHLHYAVGKLAVIDELISDGKKSKEPVKKDDNDDRRKHTTATKLPTF